MNPLAHSGHLGRSTMPGWYKACGIGKSEQQVNDRVQGTLLASVFLCPVCSTS